MSGAGGAGLRERITTYAVRDARGRLVAYHVREDVPDGTKRVRWKLPDGRWDLNGTPLADLPLYGAELVSDLGEDELIVLTEGEKARDALEAARIPAVGTVTGASGAPGPEALKVLWGRRVALWADNDDAGRAHMQRIAETLHDVAAEVLVYTWDEAPEKGDAADHPTVQSRNPKAVDRLRTDLEGSPRWKAIPVASEARPEVERKPTQAELLIRCAKGANLFHTPSGESYATVQVNDHRETYPTKSKGFRRWLVRGFFEQHERPPGTQALQDALGLLEARAQFNGPEREVYVRVAEHEGAIYLDLANERWEAVEITPAGWKVVSDPPVRFRRPRGMLALPTPKKGERENLDDLLRSFINVADDDALRLIVAWLVQAFRPTGPYPVLILQGEQGSAKSTLERLLRALVDPSTAPLRTTPRNERDLMIAATNSWCLAFDNISSLPPWLSDALCRLSTGGGFSTRGLYTDSEEVLFDAMRPVILNGITDVATRPDLLDRALIITLPKIDDEERRPEAKLHREFEKAQSSILGALFDAVAGALDKVGDVRLDDMPRMADFAVWATAAEDALGWKPGTFVKAYSGNRKEATESALDADLVAGAVRRFMNDREEWTGSATELWKALNQLVDEEVRHTKAWPGAPNALTTRLRRLATALRRVGIEFYEDRTGKSGSRKKKLTKNKPTKDRQHRQNCQPDEKNPQSQQRQADGPDKTDDRTVSTDETAKEIRQPENRIDKRDREKSDYADGADGLLRPHSNQAGATSETENVARLDAP